MANIKRRTYFKCPKVDSGYSFMVVRHGDSYG